ncbi:MULTISPECIES: hypothetical protein [Cyanophyceae]|nr:MULTISPECIES: hypothetical protein [Cyanophyceae]
MAEAQTLLATGKALAKLEEFCQQSADLTQALTYNHSSIPAG